MTVNCCGTGIRGFRSTLSGRFIVVSFLWRAAIGVVPTCRTSHDQTPNAISDLMDICLNGNSWADTPMLLLCGPVWVFCLLPKGSFFPVEVQIIVQQHHSRLVRGEASTNQAQCSWAWYSMIIKKFGATCIDYQIFQRANFVYGFRKDQETWETFLKTFGRKLGLLWKTCGYKHLTCISKLAQRNFLDVWEREFSYFVAFYRFYVKINSSPILYCFLLELGVT